MNVEVQWGTKRTHVVRLAAQRRGGSELTRHEPKTVQLVKLVLSSNPYVPWRIEAVTAINSNAPASTSVMR